MVQEKISGQIYKKVSQTIDLVPISEFSDLQTIETPDGRQVGGLKAFSGEKIEKFSLTEFCLAPGMDYINANLKPTTHYNIPRFSLNYMVLPDKIQFDVDLYPAVDLVIHQDYIDKYYERLTDVYLKEKKAPYFDCKLSERSWVRVSTSPYFFMSGTAIENEDKVHRLIHAYLDLWLKIWDEEQKVSEETAKQIEYRRMWVIKMLLEREPERHLLEKAFGRELTARLGEAMV